MATFRKEGIQLSMNSQAGLAWCAHNPDYVSHWIEQYLQGTPIPFTYTDLTNLTPFAREVLEAINRVPFGQTVTYGEIGPARAVGTACGRNLFPLVIPCHRVLAKGGLGGYTPDLSIKRELLRFEGVLA